MWPSCREPSWSARRLRAVHPRRNGIRACRTSPSGYRMNPARADRHRPGVSAAPAGGSSVFRQTRFSPHKRPFSAGAGHQEPIGHLPVESEEGLCEGNRLKSSDAVERYLRGPLWTVRLSLIGLLRLYLLVLLLPRNASAKPLHEEKKDRATAWVSSGRHGEQREENRFRQRCASSLPEHLASAARRMRVRLNAVSRLSHRCLLCLSGVGLAHFRENRIPHDDPAALDVDRVKDSDQFDSHLRSRTN